MSFSSVVRQITCIELTLLMVLFVGQNWDPNPLLITTAFFLLSKVSVYVMVVFIRGPWLFLFVGPVSQGPWRLEKKNYEEFQTNIFYLYPNWSKCFLLINFDPWMAYGDGFGFNTMRNFKLFNISWVQALFNAP